MKLQWRQLWESYGSLAAIVAVIVALMWFSYARVDLPRSGRGSAGAPSVATAGAPAPEAIFVTLDGKPVSLSSFRGKRVMFWVFATWCPSCVAGAQEMERNNEQLQDLTIIGVGTYGNAGFDGPSVGEFAETFAPSLLSAKNWIWGDLPQEATLTYNPRNLPDIYFLIDEEGMIQDIDTAPAATIRKILDFANGK